MSIPMSNSSSNSAPRYVQNSTSPFELQSLLKSGEQGIYEISLPGIVEARTDSSPESGAQRTGITLLARGLEPDTAGEYVSWIVQSLNAIPEPDYQEVARVTGTHIGIVDFGLLYGVEVNFPEKLTVAYRLTTDSCKYASPIKVAISQVVEQAQALAESHLGSGFHEVKIITPAEDPRIPNWSRHDPSAGCQTCVGQAVTFHMYRVVVGELTDRGMAHSVLGVENAERAFREREHLLSAPGGLEEIKKYEDALGNYREQGRRRAQELFGKR
jgi:hypothetical protein